MDISDSMVPSSQNEKPGSEIITVHVKDIQGGTAIPLYPLECFSRVPLFVSI